MFFLTIHQNYHFLKCFEWKTLLSVNKHFPLWSNSFRTTEKQTYVFLEEKGVDSSFQIDISQLHYRLAPVSKESNTNIFPIKFHHFRDLKTNHTYAFERKVPSTKEKLKHFVWTFRGKKRFVSFSLEQKLHLLRHENWH